ncbi:uncharacterized protein B0H64DRAFT_8862 [Chaetomium fimeti]|uniref:Uncharacterized protein n=1 Tax=Chaetomium fimeti TaxID=1854472 RepID=A0AAE0HP59_9PEZI|nr:hypothetical protein B0H64DRAFT_8862 [Chaetomium fimeti]
MERETSRPISPDIRQPTSLIAGPDLQHTKPAHLHKHGAPPSHHHGDYIYPANCHLTPPRRSHLTWLREASYCLFIARCDETIPYRPNTLPLSHTSNKRATCLRRARIPGCVVEPPFGRPTSVWLAFGSLDISGSSGTTHLVSRLPGSLPREPCRRPNKSLAAFWLGLWFRSMIAEQDPIRSLQLENRFTAPITQASQLSCLLRK